MTKLFSYVVDHDYGSAPNPFGGYCTLATCKYGSKSKKRNIVEMAENGDWIVGTGGADLSKSAGHGKLIYAMRVDKIISLAEYCRGNSGNRIDALDAIKYGLVEEDGRLALISNHFFYFGRNAINISEIPKKHLRHPFEKKGPGYRCKFSVEFIKDFAEWLNAKFKVGIHGTPCKPRSELKGLRCPSQVKRKRCN